MTEPGPKPKRFPFGEAIGVGALVISGLGLWNTWQSGKPGPTEVVERKVSVPLVLRGKIEDDGKAMIIEPVDPAHALESIVALFPGGTKVSVASDGVLKAEDVQDAMPDPDDKKGGGSVVTTMTTHYVENGTERSAIRHYSLSYRWESGGLLSGKKLRLTGFARA
jgi:hypothetical protein